MIRMRFFSLYAILFVVFFSSSSQLLATHIVGGEITYRCLGNEQYEISVVVFRDCDTGVPWFDNPAAVGVFDDNNNLIYDLRLFLRNNDTLNLNLTDPCLVAPPNLCIHTTTYVDTVSLPFRPGGYQVAYQRCCRNQDIVNIIDPLSTGATFFVRITEEALLACNSSPVFREWPPVYICANAPILFDHSAIDSDGDSIVYELCTPLTGATTNNPRPQPPLNPPYQDISWLPPYGPGNMLGGTQAALSIDPNTGLLTGVPENLGVFVVGVCAREYRNGQLLSIIRRDFQYAIGICGRRVTSAFFAPEIQCDNSLAVQFQNSSQSLGLGYEWDFGDALNPSSSTLVNPGYVYPDTGTYSIRLIADPGSLCADTTFRDINLQLESIDAGFSFEQQFCGDSVIMRFLDETTDSISQIITWDWDLGNGERSNLPNPTTVYRQSGLYRIRLRAEAANGCEREYIDSILVTVPDQLSPDTVAVCEPGQGIVLNPGGDPNLIYTWAPAVGLSSTSAVSPLATPTTSTNYSVTIEAVSNGDTCFSVQEVFVEVRPALRIDLPSDSNSCGGNFRLSPSIQGGSSTAQLNFIWSWDRAFSDTLSQSDTASISLNGQGARWVYLRVEDSYGCAAEDSSLLTQINSPLLADFDFDRLSCDSVLQVQFTDRTTDSSTGPIVSWLWNFGDGNTASSANPLHVYRQSGNYTVSLLIESAEGCTGLLSQTIPIRLARLAGRDTFGICPGQSSVQLNLGADPNLLYNWAPAASLNDPTAPSPIASPSQPTTYSVTITAIDAGDTCQAVHEVFLGFPPPFTVSLPPSQVYCGQTVSLEAQASAPVSEYLWASNPLFTTIVASGNPITITPQTTPQSIVYVRATDAFGCTATASSLVEQRVAPVDVQFGYESLGCADTMLIQFSDLTTDTLGANILSWSWFVFDGVQAQTSSLQNPQFVFRRNGNYFVRLTIILSNGCQGTATQNISLDLARLTHGSTLSLCGATEVVLNPNGNPALDYQWEAAPGLSSTTAVSPTAIPPSLPFSYRVTITSQNPGLDTCISVQDITIVDTPPPSISLPDDTSLCANFYQVVALISGQFDRLEWSLNPDFSFVPVANANPVFLNFAPPTNTTTLYARVLSNLGCVATDSVAFTYIADAIPIVADYSLVSCSDSLVVELLDLTVDTLSAPITNRQWTFYDGQSSTAQNPSFTFNDVRSWRSFRLQLGLANGCQAELIDSFDFRAARLNGSDSLSLCAGTSVELNRGGDPSLLYNWTPAASLSDATAPSPLASPSQSTWYRVSITALQSTGDTCTHIDSIFVEASDFEIRAMPDTVLCGNRLLLSAQGNRAAQQVFWSLDRDFGFILGTSDSLPTNANVGRWYYVGAIDNFGCASLDSVFVDVQSRPIVVDFDFRLIDCAPQLDIEFIDRTEDTLNNPIVSWQWALGNGQTGAGPQVLATYSAGGQYTVQLRVEGRNGCIGQLARPLSFQIPSANSLPDTISTCQGQALRLNPQAAINGQWLWLPGQGLDDPSLANPLFLADSSRLYRLQVSQNISLGAQTEICRIEDSIFALVEQAPRLSIFYDSLICQSEQELLVQSLGHSGNLNILWSRQADGSDSLSSDSLFFYQFDAAQDSVLLYLFANDASNCPLLDSLLLSYRGLEVELPDSLFICANIEELQLEAQARGFLDGLVYTWSPDADIVQGQGTERVLLQNPGLYSLELRNTAGCSAEAQAWVSQIGSLPPLQIEASDSFYSEGEILQLQATENSGYSYNWQPAAGLSALDIANPQVQPQGEEQLYRLTITDVVGCQNSAEILLRKRGGICEEPNIFVPNTFTPNGDGLNDILYVRGTAIDELYFAVYNRWGELVFESNDPQRGWDGRYRGKELNSDVYGYYLEVRCRGGEEFFKKGNVTLMR